MEAPQRAGEADLRAGGRGGRRGRRRDPAFLAAFVLAFFTAFAYAELVTKYPRAAGAALYTHRAFRAPSSRSSWPSP
jgi:hypothetical protein